jgi:hypothetical protein
MMKTAYRLSRYHLALYLRTSRFAMQAVALILFLAVLYSTAPAEAVSDSMLSAIVLFFLMVWVGFGMADDPVMEQLLSLKAGSAARRHLGDALFLATVAAIFGGVAILYPVAVNFFMRGGLYKLPLTVPDALQAYALQVSAALAGGVAGWFFHPRVLFDRKFAALTALLLAVVGLVKQGIADAWPPFAAAGWLFPPLSSVALRLANKAAFLPGDTAWSCGALLLYAGALALLRWIVLVRRKY